MKIDEKWLDTHRWGLRTSDNGVSFGGYRRKGVGKWNVADKWTGKPTCNGCGGFFAITQEHNGFGLLPRKTVELVELGGEIVPIDDDKICAEKFKVVAVNVDIPEEAFIRCGYKIARDGDVISPVHSDRYIILLGIVNVENQTGGDCWAGGDAVLNATGQTGGFCWAYDNATLNATGQAGGVCWAVGKSTLKATGQVGGKCQAYGDSKLIEIEEAEDE